MTALTKRHAGLTDDQRVQVGELQDERLPTIIASRPAPPATSDEVLAETYRHAQAEALIDIFDRHASADIRAGLRS